MDPLFTTLFTLATPILAQATSGILGNRSDALFCDTLRRLQIALRAEGELVNHELQRVVRRSALQALLYVGDRYRQELERPNSLAGIVPLLISPPPELHWVRLLERTLRHELSQIDTPTYLPPPSAADAQIERLLQPQGNSIRARADDFYTQLETEMVADLQTRIPDGQIPVRFLELLHTGWEEGGTDGPLMQVRWFDLHRAFFAYFLKQNPEWHRQYLSQLLTRLSTDVTDLAEAWTTFQETLNGMVQSLTTRLDEIHAMLRAHEEVFGSLQSQLTTLLPQLLQDHAVLQAIAGTLQQVRHLANGHFVKAGHPLPFPRRWHDDSLIDDLIARGPLAGRDPFLQSLTTSLPRGGYLLVTAPAGGGKSSLLANWVRTLRDHHLAPATCYHFFSLPWGTHEVNGALACLVEQLLGVHGIQGEIRESEPSALRSILHQTLQLHHPRPLVVVLDALDEAQDAARSGEFPLPQGLFPPRLGQNVSVVFSVRTTDGAATAVALRTQLGLPSLTTLELPPIDAQALATLLDQSPSRDVRQAGRDPEFVARLLQKTGGLPIYLRHLVEQLAQEPVARWEPLLAQLPRDFQAFVSQAARAVAPTPAWREALRFLALAPAPLATDDLLHLTEYTAHPLSREDITAIPWHVKRWLEQQNERWAFQHLAIAEAYTRHYIGTRERTDFTRYLLDYGADWEAHGSPFVLRHYPSLLRQAGLEDTTRLTQLYALAQNKKFLAQQDNSDLFTDAPNLPLHTLQLALSAAADANDATRMADFLLRHAHHVARTREETPLEALQRGQLGRAWHLADLYESEHRVLWYLVLIWQSNLQGDLTATQQTFRRVTSKPLHPLTQRWQWEAAIFLFSKIGDLKSPEFLAFCLPLLDSDARTYLARTLAEATDTLFLVEQIDTHLDQEPRTLLVMVKTQVQAGLFDEAQRTADRIQEDWMYWQAQLAIATARAGANPQALTRSAFQEVEQSLKEFWGWRRLHGLGLLSVAKSQLGSHQEAMDVLTYARQNIWSVRLEEETVLKERQSKSQDWVVFLLMYRELEALVAVATGYATLGHFRDARDLMAETHEAVRRYDVASQEEEVPGSESRLWKWIAVEEARVHSDEAALRTIEKIDPERLSLRAEAYLALSDIYLDRQQVDMARTHLRNAKSIERTFPDGQAKSEIILKTLLIEARLERPATIMAQFGWLLQTARVAYVNRLGLVKALIRTAEHLFWLGHVQQGRTLLQNSLLLAKTMPSDWYRSETLEEIAWLQAQQGDIEEAFETGDAIKYLSFKVKCLSTIVSIAVQQNQDLAYTTLLMRTLEVIERTEQEFPNDFFTVEPRYQIAKVLVLKKEFTRARDILKPIKTPFYRLSKLVQLAYFQEALGEAEGGSTLVQDVFSQVTQIKDVEERDKVICELIEIQVKNRKLEDASANLNLLITPQGKIQALSTIAKFHFEQGRNEAAAALRNEAHQIYRQSQSHLNASEQSKGELYPYSSSSDIPLPIKALADLYAQTGEVEAAITLTQDFQTANSLTKTQILATVATIQAHLGNFPVALQIVDDLDSPWLQIETYIAVAKEQAQHNYPDNAKSTFNKALDLAQRLSPDSQDYRIVNIAVGYARAGMGADVVRVASQISTGHHRHLYEIMVALQAGGDEVHFKQLLPSCAYYLDTVYRVCATLADMFPSQAKPISVLLMEEASSIQSSQPMHLHMPE